LLNNSKKGNFYVCHRKGAVITPAIEKEKEKQLTKKTIEWLSDDRLCAFTILFL
jgi:hypothetical protein